MSNNIDYFAGVVSYTGKTPTEIFNNGKPLFMLANVDDEIIIRDWNEDVLGPKPTLEQIVTAATTPTVKQLLDYASKKQNDSLAQVFTFNVAVDGAKAHNVTTKLDAAGASAMLKIAVWAIQNAGSAAVLPYSNDDFSTTTITVAEATSLVKQTGDIEAQTYTLLNQASDAIRAKNPKIKSKEEIDALPWPSGA